MTRARAPRRTVIRLTVCIASALVLAAGACTSTDPDVPVGDAARASSGAPTGEDTLFCSGVPYGSAAQDAEQSWRCVFPFNWAYTPPSGWTDPSANYVLVVQALGGPGGAGDPTANGGAGGAPGQAMTVLDASVLWDSDTSSSKTAYIYVGEAGIQGTTSAGGNGGSATIVSSAKDPWPTTAGTVPDDVIAIAGGGGGGGGYGGSTTQAVPGGDGGQAYSFGPAYQVGFGRDGDGAGHAGVGARFNAGAFTGASNDFTSIAGGTGGQNDQQPTVVNTSSLELGPAGPGETDVTGGDGSPNNLGSGGGGGAGASGGFGGGKTENSYPIAGGGGGGASYAVAADAEASVRQCIQSQGDQGWIESPEDDEQASVALWFINLGDSGSPLDCSPQYAESGSTVSTATPTLAYKPTSGQPSTGAVGFSVYPVEGDGASALITSGPVALDSGTADWTLDRTGVLEPGTSYQWEAFDATGTGLGEHPFKVASDVTGSSATGWTVELTSMNSAVKSPTVPKGQPTPAGHTNYAPTNDCPHNGQYPECTWWVDNPSDASFWKPDLVNQRTAFGELDFDWTDQSNPTYGLFPLTTLFNLQATAVLAIHFYSPILLGTVRIAIKEMKEAPLVPGIKNTIVKISISKLN